MTKADPELAYALRKSIPFVRVGLSHWTGLGNCCIGLASSTLVATRLLSLGSLIVLIEACFLSKLILHSPCSSSSGATFVIYA